MLYHSPLGLNKSIHIETIRKHYFIVHKNINPSGIIPIAPKEWWFQKKLEEKPPKIKIDHP